MHVSDIAILGCCSGIFHLSVASQPVFLRGATDSFHMVLVKLILLPELQSWMMGTRPKPVSRLHFPANDDRPKDRHVTHS